MTWEELFRIFSITKQTAEHGIDGNGDRHSISHAADATITHITKRKSTKATTASTATTVAVAAAAATPTDHYKTNFYKQK